MIYLETQWDLRLASTKMIISRCAFHRTSWVFLPCPPEGLSQQNLQYLLWTCFRGETVRQFPNRFPSKMCQILWLSSRLGSQSVAAAESLMVVGSFSSIRTGFPCGMMRHGIEDEHWNACPIVCPLWPVIPLCNIYLQQCLNALFADFWNPCFF